MQSDENIFEWFLVYCDEYVLNAYRKIDRLKRRLFRMSKFEKFLVWYILDFFFFRHHEPSRPKKPKIK